MFGLELGQLIFRPETGANGSELDDVSLFFPKPMLWRRADPVDWLEIFPVGWTAKH